MIKSSLTYINWSAEIVLSSWKSFRSESKQRCKNWYIVLPKNEETNQRVFLRIIIYILQINFLLEIHLVLNPDILIKDKLI